MFEVRTPIHYDEMIKMDKEKSSRIRSISIGDRKMRKKKGESVCELIRNRNLYPHSRVFAGKASSRSDAVREVERTVRNIAEDVNAHSYKVVDESCDGKLKKAIKWSSRDKTYEATVEYITKTEHKKRLTMSMDEWREYANSLEE